MFADLIDICNCLISHSQKYIFLIVLKTNYLITLLPDILQTTCSLFSEIIEC